MPRIDDEEPGMEKIQGVAPDLSDEDIEMERVDEAVPGDLGAARPEHGQR